MLTGRLRPPYVLVARPASGLRPARLTIGASAFDAATQRPQRCRTHFCPTLPASWAPSCCSSPHSHRAFSGAFDPHRSRQYAAAIRAVPLARRQVAGARSHRRHGPRPPPDRRRRRSAGLWHPLRGIVLTLALAVALAPATSSAGRSKATASAPPSAARTPNAQPRADDSIRTSEKHRTGQSASHVEIRSPPTDEDLPWDPDLRPRTKTCPWDRPPTDEDLSVGPGLHPRRRPVRGDPSWASGLRRAILVFDCLIW